RHPALLAVGLVALASLAVATFWPLAKSPEPAVSPATAAEAMASDETAPKPASESDDQAKAGPRLAATGVEPGAKRSEPSAPVELSTVIPRAKSPPKAVERVAPERRAARSPLTPPLSSARRELPQTSAQPSSAPTPTQTEPAVK